MASACNLGLLLSRAISAIASWAFGSSLMPSINSVSPRTFSESVLLEHFQHQWQGALRIAFHQLRQREHA